MSDNDKGNNLPKLPAIFQTDANRRFIEATIDQLYSPKNSQKMNSFAGRRNGGVYDPEQDYYLEEISRDRTWYQLEPTISTINPETLEESNYYFYDDFINRIDYLGGLSKNHDRLFSGNFYSFAPPIDFDKFINFQNYFWIPDRIDTIIISGMTDADIVENIIGKDTFNTSDFDGATPSDVEFTSGMRVEFVDADIYSQPTTIESVGRAINLVPDYTEVLASNRDFFIPWDDIAAAWDGLPWDSTQSPLSADYITIERGSVDANGWSRTNKWYHRELLNILGTINDYTLPDNAQRAERPIIEFKKDIELYKSGKKYLATVTHMVDMTYDDINGKSFDEFVNLFDGQNPANKSLIALRYPNNGEFNIYRVSFFLGTIILIPVIDDKVKDDDIIIVTAGDINRGKSFYLNNNEWMECSNIKLEENQPPRFEIYSKDGIDISEIADQPYDGNLIFSYKESEDNNIDDPVLGFPLEYRNLGQVSDITFEHNLYTDKYYQNGELIAGYYYYNNLNGSPIDLTNTFKSSIEPKLEHTWAYSETHSKQRVIDRIVATENQNKFFMSVTPQLDELGDYDVLVYQNGIKITDYSISFDGEGRPIMRMGDTISIDENDVFEIKSYTWDNLSDSAKGYFEIPKQLENNPSNAEIGSYTGNELTQHFSSIIKNQYGFEGSFLGGNNNYRDTEKDPSLGDKILQTHGSLSKSMIVNSSDDLNIIDSIRFSQLEYSRFKNKFIRQIETIVSSGWKPIITEDSIEVDEWINEVLDRLELVSEYNGAFKNAFMIASGNVYNQYRFNAVLKDSTLHIDTTAIVNKPTDFIYVYDNGILLSNLEDYTITQGVGKISVKILKENTDIFIRIYQNSVQRSIPATPSKMGCYSVFMPMIEMDDTYTTPRHVLTGHDGSKTILYGTYDESTKLFTDLRDELLFEYERRVFNGIDTKFVDPDYIPPLSLADVKEGRSRLYRPTTNLPEDLEAAGRVRYSREEYNEIIAPYFYRWSSQNQTDFKANEYYDPENWKTWNYRDVNFEGRMFNGYWRGIYKFYFDTDEPHNKPWEMLGFSIKPEWWETAYGTDYGYRNTAMWQDIENGRIIDGKRKGIDLRFKRQQFKNPVTYDPETDLVDLIPILELFGLPDDIINSLQKQKPWDFGDGAPVEDVWYRDSSYPFSVMETLFLTRPGEFGEKMWDTGRIENIQAVEGEIVYSPTYQREGESDLTVHCEVINGETTYHSGYQQWISDRLTFNLRNITTDFGNVIRGLTVKLAHKLGGFTNSDTLKVYTEGVSTSSSAISLQVPEEDIKVKKYTGATKHEYVAGGILIKIDDPKKRTYIVQGYDINTLAFKIYGRTTNHKTTSKINVGGTEASYRDYFIGKKYLAGEYVKRDSMYYQCLETHTVTKWVADYWQKIPSLPVDGGVSVNYNRENDGVLQLIPYGTTITGEQAVFDLIIGYGDWLASEGWDFNFVDTEQNKIMTWLNSAKDFLYWSTMTFDTDNTIYLMPHAEQLFLNVKEGYPSKVERLGNGVYSILDRYGVAIPPSDTLIDRDNRRISVRHKDQRVGIFGLRVSTKETEHIVTVENTTKFNDIIYDPLLGSRQERLRFNGVRTLDWIGKPEAGGYLITEDGITVNFENLTSSINEYHNTETTLDLKAFDSVAKHLIGYESREYMNALGIEDDTQYQFYMGMIREKGTRGAIDKILRSDEVTNESGITIFEEWAFKIAEYGASNEHYNLEFLIKSGELKSDPQILRLHTVVDGEIEYDDPTDSIIEVDIDDTDRWLKRPHNVNDAIFFPKSEERDFYVPNAGYVHKQDVTAMAYNPDTLYTLWADKAQPLLKDGNTIWIADDPQGRWGVYEVVDNDALSNLTDSSIVVDGETLDDISTIDADVDKYILGSERDDKIRRYLETYFNDPSIKDAGTNTNLTISRGFFRLTIEVIPDVTQPEVKTYPLDNLYYFEPRTKEQLDVITFALLDNKGEYISYKDIFSGYNFDDETADNYAVAKFEIFRNLRYKDIAERDALHLTDNLAWVDKDKKNKWVVYNSAKEIHRQEEDLIDTKLYRNGFMYDFDTQETISLLPIYDPFKGIIPGIAERNISYKTFNDPSRYNIASDESLIDSNRTFDETHVGRVWWDLSTCKFLYYEQGTMEYRRNNWGKLFTGASIDIYEWTQSVKTPDKWDGDGIPKNTTDYVVKEEYNKLRNRYDKHYYFWVKSVSTIPDSVLLRNRNMSCIDIARVITSPNTLNYSWFSPISHTEPSYVFSNINGYIDNRDVVFQVNYRTNQRESTKHVEWKLLRDGDHLSIIPDQLWNKMIDSLIGEDRNGLELPDPNLSSVEKYGTLFRPRQTWFKDKLLARKIMVEVLNRMLSELNTRDEKPSWDADIPDNSLWKYTDWYMDGFNSSNTVPSREVNSRADLSSLNNLVDGEIIRVREERFSTFKYDASLNISYLVKREKSSVYVLPKVYEEDDETIRTELRLLLQAISENIFIDSELVNNNLLYFAMVNYVASEQSQTDWFFKTTYIKAVQEGRELTQRRNYSNDPFENTTNYINEVKPYQCKIRDFVINYQTPMDIADGTAFEFKSDYVKLIYDRVVPTGLTGFDGQIIDSEEFVSETPELLDLDYDENFITDLYDFYTPSYDTDDYELGDLTGNPNDVEKNKQEPLEIVNGEIIADGYAFLQPDMDKSIPEELAPVDAGENLHILVDTRKFLPDDVLEDHAWDRVGTSLKGWDSERWDNIDKIVFDEYPDYVSYRLHLNSSGSYKYIRNSNQNQTHITDELASGNDLATGNVEDPLKDRSILEVDDLSVLGTISDKRHYAWIENEKISFRGVDRTFNRLLNVVRGVDGTPVTFHKGRDGNVLGEKIYFVTEADTVNNADDNYWTNSRGGLITSTTEQAEFLRIKPGLVNEADELSVQINVEIINNHWVIDVKTSGGKGKPIFNWEVIRTDETENATIFGRGTPTLTVLKNATNRAQIKLTVFDGLNAIVKYIDLT